MWGMYDTLLDKTLCREACQNIQSRMPPSQDMLPQLAIIAGVASLYMQANNPVVPQNNPVVPQNTNIAYAEAIVRGPGNPGNSAKFTLITTNPLVNNIEIRIDLTGSNKIAGNSGAHTNKQTNQLVQTPHMQMSDWKYTRIDPVQPTNPPKIFPEKAPDDAYLVDLATLMDIWPNPAQPLPIGTDVWLGLNQNTKDLWQNIANNNGKRDLGTIISMNFIRLVFYNAKSLLFL